MFMFSSSSIGAVVGNASTSTRGFSASIDDTVLMTKIITKISGIELKNFTRYYRFCFSWSCSFSWECRKSK